MICAMNYCDKYGYTPEVEKIDKALMTIAANIPSLISEDVLKKCFSIMDLTSLNSGDTPTSIRRFVEKVTKFHEAYPDFPLPASVCVYPNFASIVKESRISPELHATVVSACFPTSQSFIEVKTLECRMAVEAGADEVDIVLALNSFKDGDKKKAFDEIAAVRTTIDHAGAGRSIILKVILETGVLSDPVAIAEASFLAMEAGADFIKTSTGKVSVNATPMAAYIMCECIAAYHRATGRKVGFKPAGGISSAEDAVCYYSIVSTILGKEWLDKKLFRFGVSRMANNLLSAIRGETVSFF